MDDGDDYSEFEPPVQAQGPKSFRCLGAAELRGMQAADVKRVAETLASPAGDVAVLLRAFKWDCERVIGAYFENPEGVLEKAGVCDNTRPPTVNSLAPEPYRCPVCLDLVSSFSALGCGHRVCTPCYREYIAHKIDDEGAASIHARCPGIKCGVRLTEVLVNALASDAHREKFGLYLEQSYVGDNPRFEWCPAPRCDAAIYMAQPIEQAPFSGAERVKCNCGQSFCFSCRRDDHSPATCDQLTTWLVKCKDDSETFNWLQANTRTCPECKTAIEKNGGCNHMSCKKCAYEWCWVCSGPWKEHSGNFYTCNRFKEEEGGKGDDKRKDTSKAALERYLHYYTRYINHHNSLKLEQNTRAAMEEKIEEMQEHGNNTWLEGQYLKDATESLLASRHALQYTYVYAFYLAPSNHKELFEMAQRDLEVTTEDLSAEIEKPVEAIERLTVLHHQQMSKKRLENLFNAVESHRAAEADLQSQSQSQPQSQSRGA